MSLKDVSPRFLCAICVHSAMHYVRTVLHHVSEEMLRTEAKCWWFKD